MSEISEMDDDSLISALISEAIDFGKLPPNTFGETGMRWNPSRRLNELEAETRKRFLALKGSKPVRSAAGW